MMMMMIAPLFVLALGIANTRSLSPDIKATFDEYKSGIESRVEGDSILEIKAIAESMNIPPELLVRLESAL